MGRAVGRCQRALNSHAAMLRGSAPWVLVLADLVAGLCDVGYSSLVRPRASAPGRSFDDTPEETMTVADPLPAIDAVRRELEIDEQILEGTRRVRAILTLTTSLDPAPAQLWPLLTRPGELAEWFGPVAGDLHEGGAFIAPRGAHGRVLVSQEPHRLSLTWADGGDEGTLALRLDPEDDGSTLLVLRHSALLDAEEFERTGPGVIALRWEVALLALAARTSGWDSSCLLEAPVPSPDWLRSPEGRAHLRSWSVRWAAAAVAAGVGERVARRGEDGAVEAFLTALGG